MFYEIWNTKSFTHYNFYLNTKVPLRLSFRLPNPKCISNPTCLIKQNAENRLNTLNL